MEVTLVRVRPDGRKQAVSVQRDRSLIGRDTRCHLRIPSSAVSRRHAELRVEEGQVTLEDLGSSNGTYVNQERISGPRLLAPGDLVAIGDLVFVVQIEGEPAEINAMLAYEDGFPASIKRPPAGAAPGGSGGREGEVARPASGIAPPLVPGASDESSMMDFEFDLDDEDDQPELTSG